MQISSCKSRIIQQSFKIIDQEFGSHQFSPEEYVIVRRIIHSSADFEFKELLSFSHNAILSAIAYLQQGLPIVTDVSMVAQGIRAMAHETFQNPIINALDYVDQPLPGATRTETGIINLLRHYPDALYVIGNAPTALIALCKWLSQQSDPKKKPSVVIGAPVGFVSVLESKALLQTMDVEQIVVQGRKGGSAVAAGIINALLYLAWGKNVLGIEE
ncbi:MAG: cobalt-precorrin-8X methylmutase [Acaryochloridaceae cyanobacterium RL_2_7]|nr:cobalt-precorrin-8X methylmutase [Acaryochloridaceae cyanobacterium RL_2_7]